MSQPRNAVLVVEDEILIRMEAVDMMHDAGSVSYTHLTLPTTPYV